MVKLGDVTTFPDAKPDKTQVLKIGEEAMEVFSAWENWRPFPNVKGHYKKHLLDECADVIQATCNLISALGEDDFTPYMEACKLRNKKKGRL